jgi:rubrerythrin
VYEGKIMGMNTEEWFKWLLEHNKMDNNFNLETVIFLLDEIRTMSPLNFEGCLCYDYHKVKKLAEEAKMITYNVNRRLSRKSCLRESCNCPKCGAIMEGVRPGKVQCPNCG